MIESSFFEMTGKFTSLYVNERTERGTPIDGNGIRNAIQSPYFNSTVSEVRSCVYLLNKKQLGYLSQ